MEEDAMDEAAMQQAAANTATTGTATASAAEVKAASATTQADGHRRPPGVGARQAAHNHSRAARDRGEDAHLVREQKCDSSRLLEYPRGHLHVAVPGAAGQLVEEHVCLAQALGQAELGAHRRDGHWSRGDGAPLSSVTPRSVALPEASRRPAGCPRRVARRSHRQPLHRRAVSARGAAVWRLPQPLRTLTHSAPTPTTATFRACVSDASSALLTNNVP